MDVNWVQVVFRVLCEEAFQTFTEKRFVPDVRAAVVKLLLSGEQVLPGQWGEHKRSELVR